jgi:hypothetical protein
MIGATPHRHGPNRKLTRVGRLLTKWNWRGALSACELTEVTAIEAEIIRLEELIRGLSKERGTIVNRGTARAKSRRPSQ